MSVELEDITGEEQDAAFGGEDDAAKPAAVTQPAVDPEALTRRILAEVQSTIREAMPRAEQQKQRSAYESVVADMLAKNYDPQAISSLIKLQMASDEDRAAKKRIDDLETFVKNYEAKCWEMADDALSAYEGSLKALKDDEIKAAILSKTSKIFANDKEFEAEREKGSQGLLPSKASVKKAVAKAVQDYCDKNGLNYKPTPSLDLRNSKPDPVSAKSDDPYDGLTESQRKYANSIKSHLKLTPAEAAKRARAFNKSA